jgi:subtilisin family serine protease
MDPYRAAVERAAEAGVIVVAAAGNNGPYPLSVSAPSVSAAVISVGATGNDRTFSTGLRTSAGSQYFTLPPDGNWPTGEVSAPLADVSTVDSDGLACGPLPAGSFSGRIVLVQRGTCLFSEKLMNVQAAGGVGALVYAREDQPALLRMSIGTLQFPAQFLTYGDGVRLKGEIAADPSISATLVAGPENSPQDSSLLAAFSSRGPNAEGLVKPDLVAVGTSLYTAAQSIDSEGDGFDSSGYMTAEGTSFSSPIVAGAAAVLKAARPGLTSAQYRSLLINSTAPPATVRVQSFGAGVLDLDAALRASLVASPVSVSYGAGDGTFQLSRVITFTNLGDAPDTFTVTVEPKPRTDGPVPSTNSISLDPGASAAVSFDFNGYLLEPGEYEGYIVVQGTRSEIRTRVPYWYAVPSGAPAFVNVLDVKDSGKVGSTVRQAVVFQVTDRSGVALPESRPRIVPLDGGDYRRLISADSEIPGVFVADLVLGTLPGTQRFRIEVGELTATVSLQATP